MESFILALFNLNAFDGINCLSSECFLSGEGLVAYKRPYPMTPPCVCPKKHVVSRLAFLVLLACLPLSAQERVTAPRADGQNTPLLLYRPALYNRGCAPLAVIS